MKIPRTVSIMGKRYQVKLCKKPWDKNGSWGSAFHKTLTIRLRADLAHDELEECFLHELLHCAAVQTLSRPVKEQTIYGISSGLYAILKDNGIRFSGKKTPSRRGR